MSAIKYWVWLSALNLDPVKKLRLLDRFSQNPMEIYFSTDDELRTADGISDGDLAHLGRRELDSAMEILGRCEAEGISVITLQDAGYPKRLQNIYDPPVVLYVKGRLPAMDEEPAIAIVGTRNATPYGQKMARRMGYELTKCGGLVVSGLTRGIDRYGAEGALRAGGRVVGVLGTGLDEIREGLYGDVAAVGALVSEYPPGMATRKSNFRQRNRITAGLSAGVVVVEAPKESGALLFAHEALEQGKEIFAIPGNADAVNSVGTNRLIQDGAKSVSNGWDVLCELEGLFREKIKHPGEKNLIIPQETVEEKPKSCDDFVQVRRPRAKKVIDNQKPVEYIDLEKQLEGLSETQLVIVSVIKAKGTHVDDIIEATGLDSQTVLSELTMLQIEGIVTQEPGKRFTLNIARG